MVTMFNTCACTGDEVQFALAPAEPAAEDKFCNQCNIHEAVRFVVRHQAKHQRHAADGFVQLLPREGPEKEGCETGRGEGGGRSKSEVNIKKSLSVCVSRGFASALSMRAGAAAAAVQQPNHAP